MFFPAKYPIVHFVRFYINARKKQKFVGFVSFAMDNHAFGSRKVGLEKRKNDCLFLVANPQSAYYRSEKFGKILQYLTRHQRQCQLREQNGRRSVVFSDIKTVERGMKVFEEFG